jgi:nicotinate-nucleotide adenylyltransferase
MPPPDHWIKLPVTSPGMRIGLLGGSFNPPHAGHRHLSLEALKRLSLDRVWWMVSPGNPLKRHDDLATLGNRLKLASRVALHPHIDVTGFEAALGTAYTAETLAYLFQRSLGVRFVWLMGADNLASFHHWNHWRDIVELVPMAVFDRPAWRYKAMASRAALSLACCKLPESQSRLLAWAIPPAWSLITIPLSSLSSSKIRANSSLHLLQDAPVAPATYLNAMPKALIS